MYVSLYVSLLDIQVTYIPCRILRYVSFSITPCENQTGRGAGEGAAPPPPRELTRSGNLINRAINVLQQLRVKLADSDVCTVCFSILYVCNLCIECNVMK